MTATDDRRVTPLWVIGALAAFNVVITAAVWATSFPGWTDWALIGVQLVALGVLIVLGVRNQRIFRARLAALRSGRR